MIRWLNSSNKLNLLYWLLAYLYIINKVTLREMDLYGHSQIIVERVLLPIDL